MIFFLFSSIFSDNLSKQKFLKFQNILKRNKKIYLKENLKSLKEKLIHPAEETINNRTENTFQK